MSNLFLLCCSLNVVGTQCGTLSTHPLAVNISLYGVLVEVEVHVNKFLAHHIHVALQNQGRAVLVTLCGRLTYQHVTPLNHLKNRHDGFSVDHYADGVRYELLLALGGLVEK